ncbi:peroxidasin-like [Daphnia pulicaria]|uniref:peroxidasin-like n=1 Tax=Daphnia pulicaria TaxID=35523 RepID=UPI001EEA0FF6|nr:peroxidasin-like [Daphnia pulicaria]
MTSIMVAILTLSASTLLLADENGSNRQISPLPTNITCDPKYKYRSYDGSCNNLLNPRFGQAGTIFQRLMGPANYADGISKIRLSQSGAPLPSARLITTTVTVNESVSNPDVSFMTMQWGQFLDHDLTKITQFTIAGGCCDGGRFGNVTANPNPECLYILVPNNDPTYTNANCINMIRSNFGLYLNGSTPTAREQVNSLTHWIDGSQIYGSSNATAQSLRNTTSKRGLMNVSLQNGKVLLPLTNTCCSDNTTTCAEAASCFVAGDSRVKQHTLITIMHTLWLREHNRVANVLYAKYGASKTDEFYYQEARRIVIAELQHITYNEFLPVIIGPSAQFKGPYNNKNNSALFNEFTTAAYRMGHSLIRSFIRVYEADGTRSNQSYLLGTSFGTATRLRNPNFIDNAIRGLLKTPAQTVDECFADDITSQLSKTPAALLGGDLISINMQRGRDHGLPNYIQARQIALNLKTPLPTTFDALSPTTSPEIITYFKKIYGSVNDIDLYIGGVTETKAPGSLVGPTFTYIIAKQFENLRQSDRFFYTDVTQSVSFTAKQLVEIKKVSLARIICDNSDGTVTQVQPQAFRTPTGTNMPIPCGSIPQMDFEKYAK